MRAMAALLAVLLILESACTSYRQVPPFDIKDPKDTIYAATCRTGKVVTFKASEAPSKEFGDPGYAVYGYYVWNTRSVDGVAVTGEHVSLPVDSLQSVRVRRFNPIHMALIFVGVAGVVAALCLIALSSASSIQFGD